MITAVLFGVAIGFTLGVLSMRVVRFANDDPSDQRPPCHCATHDVRFDGGRCPRALGVD